MIGEKGICQAGQIRRTKFDTKEHAEENLNFYKQHGFVPLNYVVYKCKECACYHFGKLEWAEEFAK